MYYTAAKKTLLRVRDEMTYRLHWVEKKGDGRSSARLITTIPCIVVVLAGSIFVVSTFSDYSAIESVKNATGENLGYSEITCGYAYDNFFDGAIWSAEADGDGNDIVTVKGQCLYLDEPAAAKVEFTLFEETDVFMMTGSYLYGEPQNEWLMLALQDEVFESAAEQLGIGSDYD